MKLIIDISDDIYNRLQTDFVSAGNTFYDTALNSIINGTPVSTDGDLISRSALKKEFERYEEGDVFYVGQIIDFFINHAPTVSIKSCRECPFVADEEKQISEVD